MQREIPHKLDHGLLFPLLGKYYFNNVNAGPEEYFSKIEEFERRCEKSLIETFARIRVRGLVKTDPYSLPYNNEEVVLLHGESYLNGPYEFYRAARKIIKRILNENHYKIRFYLFINVITNKGFMGMGVVEYRFRYHVKK